MKIQNVCFASIYRNFDGVITVVTNEHVYSHKAAQKKRIKEEQKSSNIQHTLAYIVIKHVIHQASS